MLIYTQLSLLNFHREGGKGIIGRSVFREEHADVLVVVVKELSWIRMGMEISTFSCDGGGGPGGGPLGPLLGLPPSGIRSGLGVAAPGRPGRLGGMSSLG